MNNETHHLDFHTGTCPDNHTAILPPLPSEAYAGVNVLLASNSPRRRELLGLILPSFEIATPRDVDEVYPPDMSGSTIFRRG